MSQHRSGKNGQKQLKPESKKGDKSKKKNIKKYQNPQKNQVET